MKETLKKKKTQRSKPRKRNKGKDLLEQVIRLTGIPSKIIKRELVSILERKNVDVSSLTIDELRGAVATYLREIVGGMLEKHQRQETQH